MLLNGEVFDSSYARNMPIEFILGTGRVIKGWDEGISLIPIGASAKLVIPSNLAYGERGAGGVIPPNSTLIFEIEVLSVQEPSYKVIDSNQLLSMQDNDLIIVDIRSEKEWKKTGIIKQSKKITAFDEQGNLKSFFLNIPDPNI